MNLKTRLDGHFLACSAVAAAAAIGGATQTADAQIVYSGVVNINIPSTTNGLYMNILTGQINEPGNTSGTSVPGWDINPWGTGLAYWSPSSPAGGAYVQRTGGGATANLPMGTLIGAASVFGGSGASISGNEPHILNSNQNLIGFRFLNEGNSQVHYAWMRISLDSTLGGQPRTLVEYAFEATPGVAIGAGVIPAPGSLALLALGAVGMSSRRRK
jgi:hypothetical protein